MIQKLRSLLTSISLYLEPYRPLILYHMVYITFYTFIAKIIFLVYIYIYYFYFETFIEFTQRLAIIFFIISFLYALLHRILPLNRWADRAVIYILSNTSFLLFFVYIHFETHYYYLRGDLYEKFDLKDKILMGLAFGSTFYTAPVVCTVLNFHLGVVVWGFFLFLPYYITRLYDTTPLTPMYNMELVREIIDNDQQANTLIFNDDKYAQLPAEIKELYKNIYCSLKDNSIFFPTFMFYLHIFNRYNLDDIRGMFGRSLLRRFNRFFTSESYRDYIYESQGDNGKFMFDIPLCDKDFLLSGGIISTRTYLLRQVISGTVAVGSGAILAEQYFKRSKELQDDKFKHEKYVMKFNASERDKERQHELMMKGIIKPSSNSYSIWPLSRSNNGIKSPPTTGGGSLSNLD